MCEKVLSNIFDTGYYLHVLENICWVHDHGYVAILDLLLAILDLLVQVAYQFVITNGVKRRCTQPGNIGSTTIVLAV